VDTTSEIPRLPIDIGMERPLTIIDHATEELITEFTDCGGEAVNDAVAPAKAAIDSGVWSQMPGRERAKIMWRTADLIDQHANEFARLNSLNTGMPLMQAQLQIPTCAEFFRYYAGPIDELTHAS
jgi:phenylacetaldehyde dehydrogenase